IVSGGGTSTMITVKWDTPQNSAGVMAFGPQGSGSAWVNIGGGTPPSVSITSSVSSICKGSSVTFTASGTGGGSSPTYAWYVNGSHVAGVTGKTFTTSSLPAGSNEVHAVMYSSLAGCQSSSSATSNKRTVTWTGGNYPVTITQAPMSCQSTMGWTFVASVYPHEGSLTYKWYRNGSLVSSDPGTATAPQVLYLGTVNNNDVITCQVSTTANCYLPGTSNAITVEVGPKIPFDVGISVNSPIVCKGAPVTFTAAYPGDLPVTYSWKVHGNYVGNGNTYTMTA